MTAGQWFLTGRQNTCPGGAGARTGQAPTQAAAPSPQGTEANPVPEPTPNPTTP